MALITCFFKCIMQMPYEFGRLDISGILVMESLALLRQG